MINNKFWQHSTFDLKTGKELSYEDSKGLKYKFNSNCNLLYFNNLTQDILNNLPPYSEIPMENIFLDLFRGSILKADFNIYFNLIFFF